jgi:hypothetical protein
VLRRDADAPKARPIPRLSTDDKKRSMSGRKKLINGGELLIYFDSVKAK